MSKTPEEIVRTFLAAVAVKDYLQMGQLLADNFSFSGPVAATNTKQAYLDLMQTGGGKMVKDVKIKRVIASGSDVATIVDSVTSTPAGAIPMAEIFRVENGKIVDMVQFFDARVLAK